MTGTRFHRVYPEQHGDTLVAGDKMRKVVFCSGKIYYELLKQRRADGCDDVALVRLEQFSPFPFNEVARELRKYPSAELVWCQEEPKNMGAWYFVRDRLLTTTRTINEKVLRPAYVGRRTMASPAEGYGDVHLREQSKILKTALGTKVSAFPFGCVGARAPRRRNTRRTQS